MSGFRIKRNCAGSYDVGHGGFDPQHNYVVHISYQPNLKGWMVRAAWDRYLYSDPVETYRSAKHVATSMLKGILDSEQTRLEKICA